MGGGGETCLTRIHAGKSGGVHGVIGRLECAFEVGGRNFPAELRESGFELRVGAQAFADGVVGVTAMPAADEIRKRPVYSIEELVVKAKAIFHVVEIGGPEGIAVSHTVRDFFTSSGGGLSGSMDSVQALRSVTLGAAPPVSSTQPRTARREVMVPAEIRTISQRSGRAGNCVLGVGCGDGAARQGVGDGPVQIDTHGARRVQVFEGRRQQVDGEGMVVFAGVPRAAASFCNQPMCLRRCAPPAR